ncbi:MAG: hypothetical protein LBH19_10360 [Dysgonamonadaceae bacterium]|nr:hypothetical protein [Dysgonamonadaceae bacterium]
MLIINDWQEIPAFAGMTWCFDFWDNLLVINRLFIDMDALTGKLGFIFNPNTHYPLVSAKGCLIVWVFILNIHKFTKTFNF